MSEAGVEAGPAFSCVDFARGVGDGGVFDVGIVGVGGGGGGGGEAVISQLALDLEARDDEGEGVG